MPGAGRAIEAPDVALALPEVAAVRKLRTDRAADRGVVIKEHGLDRMGIAAGMREAMKLIGRHLDPTDHDKPLNGSGPLFHPGSQIREAG